MKIIFLTEEKRKVEIELNNLKSRLPSVPIESRAGDIERGE